MMNNRILILSVFIILSISSFNVVNAQDLIVTDKGDSINCKITKSEKDFLYFTFKFNGEYRNTLIPMAKVTDFKIDFYAVGNVPTEIVKTIIGSKYNRFRFVVNGGFSYRTAGNPDNLSSEGKEYINGLRPGYNIGAEFNCFLSESMSLGLKYSMFNSSSNYKNTIKEDIVISYVGPSFVVRLPDRTRDNAFFIGLSFGYMGYRDDANISGYDYILTGSTMGMTYDIGYDIGISKRFAVGFQLSFCSGIISEMTEDDGTTVETYELVDDEREGLGRIDFSVGLRIK